jgi:Tfp pilus assembly protein PilO
MNPQTKQFNSWWWVGYPVAVAAFIFFSLNFFLNNSQMISDLTVKKDEVEAQEKQAEQLKSKLTDLKKIDSTQETEKLKRLLEAMPASRKVWYMIQELNQAASEGGVIIKEYRGVVGDVKEASESASPSAEADATGKMSLKVTYDYFPFESWKRNLAVLQKILPLMKVLKVAYSDTETELIVEGAWGPWTMLSKDALSPLPDYQGLSDRVITEIDKLGEMSSY